MASEGGGGFGFTEQGADPRGAKAAAGGEAGDGGAQAGEALFLQGLVVVAEGGVGLAEAFVHEAGDIGAEGAVGVLVLLAEVLAGDGEALVAQGVDRDAGRLARAHPTGLALLEVGDHPALRRDQRDQLAAGRHPLALTHPDLAQLAVGGRGDEGVGQIDLGQAQGGLGRGDGGLQALARDPDRADVLAGDLAAGPVNINPFVVGRITAYDTGFDQFSPKEDDRTRAFGSAAFARGRFPVRFNNAIWIRTTTRGVRFWTLLGPLTFGTMRPFFLPWVEIERVERRKELFGESLKLHIRGFGGSITLIGRLAKAFAAAWKEPA